MEWLETLLLILGGFLMLMGIGVPVAFAFALVNIICAYFLWGVVGFPQIILSIYDSVTKFTLLPIIMFILMGEVMFHSKMGSLMLDVFDKWLGRLPGRLSLVTVAGGAMFSTMSGASIGTTAMLGSMLVPEMQKRGYKKPMIFGPILGSGGLAMMIPPSGLGIILAVLAEISLGKLLVSILIPGVVMAIFYAGYIIIRCYLQPSIAPAYETSGVPLREKIILGIKYVLPLGSIIFLVLGMFFFGVATPSEAAALGGLGTFIISSIYKRMSWEVIKKSINGTLRVSVMVLMIITGSALFSQILAFSGATRGLVQTVVGLPLPPIALIIMMLLIALLLGTFMEVTSIMMITIPIFMPIVNAIGYNPILFCTVLLLVFEMSQTTPPFGILLYVLKSVSPAGTTIRDCVQAALPFLLLDFLVVILLINFPIIALWLPNIMR